MLTYDSVSVKSLMAMAGKYRKKVLINAVKVDGPFRVLTQEGPLECQDGYVAVDGRGYPYPIETSIFHEMYEKVDSDETQ